MPTIVCTAVPKGRRASETFRLPAGWPVPAVHDHVTFQGEHGIRTGRVTSVDHEIVSGIISVYLEV